MPAVLVLLGGAYTALKGERYMMARISDMQEKEVINVCDGKRLGYVDDLEIDTCTAQITALVISGCNHLFGLLGRDSDIVIKWQDIEVVGEETILVNFTCPSGNCKTSPKAGHILGGLFK